MSGGDLKNIPLIEDLVFYQEFEGSFQVTKQPGKKIQSGEKRGWLGVDPAAVECCSCSLGMKHLLFFEDGVVGTGDITQLMWGMQHGWEVGPSATTWPKRPGGSLVLRSPEKNALPPQ